EDQLGLSFDCADANDAVAVEVHAWDEAGNHDYCVTMILVQDNNEICDSPVASSGNIAGLIATEDVAPVEGTEVQLSGGRSMMYLTSEGGDYGFENLDYGLDYTVAPLKDQNHRNGVSTFDLILIQKHILGTTLLDSPYKMIAADANNSRSISTLDLIQIRKLILNIDTEFANNTSWRFVDADYRFPNATNPWLTNFPEIRNINNLDNQTTLANFVGVKIGDVNGSARANAAQDLAPRRIVDVMEISTEELDMKQGNVYTVSFKASMEDIAGYQFTLEVDQSAAQIVDVKAGVAKAENFGVFTEEGVITTSFHRSAEEEINGEVLFSLTLRATSDAALSEAIGINSRYTAAEAYDTADEELAVGLVVGKDYSESDFALYQNRPNPFSAETVISFKLPEAMEAVLEFKDISGRTILLREGDFTSGYNELRMKADDLPAAGVYFYTLHAGDFVATKKMVLTK
ncbi:MAG TPA: cohesin domain-containing protein, partial [Saprospiraceae bacterium]|nr:cohesin domain-containing protein [Saprospiraceae bacterium]